MRVALLAAFDTVSGYGRDAVDLAVYLDRAGVDIVPYPTAIEPGLPMQFCRLLTADPIRPPDVALQFTWPGAVDVDRLHTLARKAAVYTMHERIPFRTADLPRERRLTYPPQWSRHTSTHFGRRRTGLDGFAVTHHNDVEAFTAWDDGLNPVVIPCGIDPDWPVIDRRVDRPITFLASGKLGTPRKNIDTLLETWRATKAANPDWDARLILHSVGAGVHPADADIYGPGIAVDLKVLPADGLAQLYADADVLVSVSRGEGNDKPAMEFLATGGPVMLSDWSAHTSYLHESVGWRLPGEVVEHDDPGGAFRDFEVDRDALSAALLSVTREQVITRGRAAAPWIRASHGWPVVAEKLAQWLATL